MQNGITVLRTVVTAGALLTLGALAMLTTASNQALGPSPAQINSFELMVHARNLPDQTIENLF